MRRQRFARRLEDEHERRSDRTPSTVAVVFFDVSKSTSGARKVTPRDSRPSPFSPAGTVLKVGEIVRDPLADASGLKSEYLERRGESSRSQNALTEQTQHDECSRRRREIVADASQASRRGRFRPRLPECRPADLRLVPRGEDEVPRHLLRHDRDVEAVSVQRQDPSTVSVAALIRRIDSQIFFPI